MWLQEAYRKLFVNRGEGALSSRPFLFWGAFLAAMLLKYGYYGLHYFPVMDDNNLYGVFSMMPPAAVLVKYLASTVRPGATLLDAFLWSRLWGGMWLALLGITLLHFLSCLLMWLVFAKNKLKIGVITVTLFGLLPLGTEATYWISASSKEVAGLFFAALSFYLLTLYIERRERTGRSAPLYLAAFFAANLFSLGFYEQVTAFSFAGAMLLFIVNWRRLRRLKPAWPGRLAPLIPLANLSMITLYYRHFSDTGNLAARGQLLHGHYLQHTIVVFHAMKNLLLDVQWQMLHSGLTRGVRLMIADRAVIYVVLAVAVGLLLGLCAAREKPSGTLPENAGKLVLGGFLALLPFAPFFLISYAWIYNRNAFLSLLGLGLMAEALAYLVFRGRIMAVLRGALLGVLILALLLADTSEVTDYRSVSLGDREICSEFIAAATQASPAWYEQGVILFNARPVLVSLTAEQIQSCTANDWFLMAALESALRIQNIAPMTPVPDNSEFTLAADRLRGSLYLGTDDRIRVFPLSGTWKDGDTLELKELSGAVFGVVGRRPGGRENVPGAYYFQGAAQQARGEDD